MNRIRTLVAVGVLSAVGSAVAGAQQVSSSTVAKVAVDEPARIEIKAGTEGRARISPNRAKAIALARVPGQIAGGELTDESGRLVYEIKVLPEKKKTYSKVVIDARTGRVLSVKQYGGVRGAVGYVRESGSRKRNKADAARQP
ncbi:MAG: PepSY domain-containing protein [Gemmatimonadota bacterium]|nr:PepSY domain-containing protein [Gemmatimonadota bacterium]